MRSDCEEGSYLRLVDSCITQSRPKVIKKKKKKKTHSRAHGPRMHGCLLKG